MPPHVADPLELVAAARERRGVSLTRAERITHGAATIAFIAGAALLVARTAQPVQPVPILIALVAIAFASRIELEIGSGFGSPAEILLVPMLLALPAGYVPLVVAVALTLAQAPDVVRRRVPLERCLIALGNALYSLAPAAVVLFLHHADDRPARTAAVLGLAVAAQLVTDAVVSMVTERLALGIAPRELVRPIGWVWVIDASLAFLGFSVALAGEAWRPAYLLPLPFLGLAHAFSRERAERLSSTMELSAAYKGTAMLLGDVVEADDIYTGQHSRQVVDLVVEVARSMQLSARDERLAEFTALLHDIGKIKIPSSIINKPGPLDDDELALMRTHTIEGERLLQQVGGFLAEVGRVVRSCHERWDGLGYPDALAGEEIPLVARIVCCCDAYNAMTTDRSYRRAMPVHVALGELFANRGSQFDPDVVDALVSLRWQQMGATVRPPFAPAPRVTV